MPWCPECKTEFREGFENCNDCGVKLVDVLPVEVELRQNDEVEAFLATAENGVQADILESKLKFYGIPVLQKYRKIGGYLKVFMGVTPFGIDLYVPSKSLELAKALISTEPESDVIADKTIEYNENDVQNNDENDVQNDVYNLRKRKYLLILFWMLMIPGLIILIINLIKGVLE